MIPHKQQVGKRGSWSKPAWLCNQALHLKWLQKGVTISSSTIRSLDVVETLPIVSTSLLVRDTETNSEDQGNQRSEFQEHWCSLIEMVFMEPMNLKQLWSVVIMKHGPIIETMNWCSLGFQCTYLLNSSKGTSRWLWFTKMLFQHIWYFSWVHNVKIIVGEQENSELQEKGHGILDFISLPINHLRRMANVLAPDCHIMCSHTLWVIATPHVSSFSSAPLKNILLLTTRGQVGQREEKYPQAKASNFQYFLIVYLHSAFYFPHSRFHITSGMGWGLS